MLYVLKIKASKCFEWLSHFGYNGHQSNHLYMYLKELYWHLVGKVERCHYVEKGPSPKYCLLKQLLQWLNIYHKMFIRPNSIDGVIKFEKNNLLNCPTLPPIWSPTKNYLWKFPSPSALFLMNVQHEVLKWSALIFRC
jgi:hypothetical protein